MSEMETANLSFDPSDLRRGPKHSGRQRRVVAECHRCSLRYEIGEGGNVECPDCNQIDAARVILRELTTDRWQKVDPKCAVPSCLNIPTHEVVVVESIPGTPRVPTLLCDDHKNVLVTRPLAAPDADSE